MVVIVLNFNSLIILIVFVSVTSATVDYFNRREYILEKEYRTTIAGSEQLNKLEEKANAVLMQYKHNELFSGIHHPKYYPPLQPIEEFLEHAKLSDVYQILKAMPKAGLLHTHELGAVSAEYIHSLTYRDDLYICFDGDHHRFKLKFFDVPDNTCEWISMDEKRKDPYFEPYLVEGLSLLKGVDYRDQKHIAVTMKDLRQTLAGLLNYKPVFEDVVYELFSELYLDGIRYVEVRCNQEFLYDLEGNTYDNDDIACIYQRILEEFQQQFPDFYDAKLIFTVGRDISDQELQDDLNIYRELTEKYGSLIAGFDIAGKEDDSRPLKEMVEFLLPLKESGSIQFFLHAGASNWYGTAADENLVDALLLGTKRIGHGTALVKHPRLMQMAKQNNVAVEISPVCDLVITLVRDIRSHPAAVLAALGVNIVIGNENPGLWKGEGVTYDWFLAFMGFGSAQDGLGYLKKLAVNSIEYSALQQKQKHDLFEIFIKDWNIFIKKLANGELV